MMLLQGPEGPKSSAPKGQYRRHKARIFAIRGYLMQMKYMVFLIGLLDWRAFIALFLLTIRSLSFYKIDSSLRPCEGLEIV